MRLDGQSNIWILQASLMDIEGRKLAGKEWLRGEFRIVFCHQKRIRSSGACAQYNAWKCAPLDRRIWRSWFAQVPTVILLSTEVVNELLSLDSARSKELLKVRSANGKGVTALVSPGFLKAIKGSL